MMLGAPFTDSSLLSWSWGTLAPVLDKKRNEPIKMAAAAHVNTI